MTFTDGDKIAAAILVVGNASLEPASVALTQQKYRRALELVARFRSEIEDVEVSIPGVERSPPPKK